MVKTMHDSVLRATGSNPRHYQLHALSNLQILRVKSFCGHKKHTQKDTHNTTCTPSTPEDETWLVEWQVDELMLNVLRCHLTY